jgi:hypothetical protein
VPYCGHRVQPRQSSSSEQVTSSSSMAPSGVTGNGRQSARLKTQAKEAISGVSEWHDF